MEHMGSFFQTFDLLAYVGRQQDLSCQTGGRFPLGRRLPVGVFDIRRNAGECRQRDQRIAQIQLAFVEIVIAQSIEVEPHHVHNLDCRCIAEEGRDGRRSAERVHALSGQEV